jgi:DNA-binding transcriptional MocR family regulator
MEDFLSEDQNIDKSISSNSTSENDFGYAPSEVSSKPKLNIKKSNNEVVISFDKNEADSIKIFSKRSYEDNFSLLAEIAPDSNYVDNRPNSFNAPELREYMAQYVKKDAQMGASSDVVLIIKKDL